MVSSLTRTLLTLVCVSLFVGLVVADTIKLKNGSVIKGKVTTYNEREFTVYLDLGTSSKRSTSRMVIAVEDIESIQFDRDEAGGALTPPTTDSGARTAIKEPATREPTKPAASVPTLSNAPPPAQPANAGEPAATEKTVSVVAAADWTSTEIRVRKGQRVTISATGQIDLGSGRRSNPEGTTINDPKKLILNSPTGALIAVIGDDNDDFIPIGSQATFVAERDGILFLSINEANLRDNAGSFAARVRVLGK